MVRENERSRCPTHHALCGTKGGLTTRIILYKYEYQYSTVASYVPSYLYFVATSMKVSYEYRSVQ